MKQKSTLYSIISFLSGILLLFAFSFQFSSAQDFKFQQDDSFQKLVVMEAENFSENIPNGDVTWAETQEPIDYSGTAAMVANMTEGDFGTVEKALAGSPILVYKINFTEAGTHYIWARAARGVGGEPGGTDSYHAGLDAGIATTATFINFENRVPEAFEDGTWGWIQWCNPEGVQASVVVPAAGVHEFIVYIREKQFRIDKIVLTTVPYNDGAGYYPENFGPDETLAPSGIISASLSTDAFSIHPNPVSDHLDILITDGVSYAGTIEIVDITGKVIQRVAADYCRTVSKDVSGLDAGVYFVKLDRAGKTIAVKKMLKL